MTCVRTFGLDRLQRLYISSYRETRVSSSSTTSYFGIPQKATTASSSTPEKFNNKQNHRAIPFKASKIDRRRREYELLLTQQAAECIEISASHTEEPLIQARAPPEVLSRHSTCAWMVMRRGVGRMIRGAGGSCWRVRGR